MSKLTLEKAKEILAKHVTVDIQTGELSFACLVLVNLMHPASQTEHLSNIVDDVRELALIEHPEVLVNRLILGVSTLPQHVAVDAGVVVGMGAFDALELPHL